MPGKSAPVFHFEKNSNADRWRPGPARIVSTVDINPSLCPANWRESDTGPRCWATELTPKEGVHMKYDVTLKATVEAESAEAAEKMFESVECDDIITTPRKQWTVDVFIPVAYMAHVTVNAQTEAEATGRVLDAVEAHRDHHLDVFLDGSKVNDYNVTVDSCEYEIVAEGVRNHLGIVSSTPLNEDGMPIEDETLVDARLVAAIKRNNPILAFYRDKRQSTAVLGTTES